MKSVQRLSNVLDLKVAACCWCLLTCRPIVVSLNTGSPGSRHSALIPFSHSNYTTMPMTRSTVTGSLILLTDMNWRSSLQAMSICMSASVAHFRMCCAVFGITARSMTQAAYCFPMANVTCVIYAHSALSILYRPCKTQPTLLPYVALI